MSLTSKVFCFFVFLSSFLLMLATGQSNVRNFERVQDSIAEIFEDRLVVKGLIFELSSLVHKKEIALVSNDVDFFKQKNKTVNAEIDEQLQAFWDTKLTKKEESTLKSFSQDIEKLKSSEAPDRLENKAKLPDDYARDLRPQIDKLKADLRTLSEIQLSEGKKKLKSCKLAVKRMNQFASLEYYTLILLAILMLGLFFVPSANDAEDSETQ